MKSFTGAAIIAAILALSFAQIDGDVNDHETHNETEYLRLTLNERLEIEKSTIHWLPYKRILVHERADGTEEEECWVRPRAIEEFPQGFWTREQRLRGLFLIHIFTAIYFFIILAFICDKYFLPTVEVICDKLNLSQDVAASTFMATATTTPEFFANVISTFVADSDMGLSAIIGSMLFNTLGVAACASIFARKPIQIDWWPITRDSIVLSVNVIILVVFAWDGVIMWYETIVLVVLYVGYWILMFQNPRIMKFVKHVVEDRLMWCQRIKNYDIANQQPLGAVERKPSQGQIENGHSSTESNPPNGIRNSFKFNGGFDNNGYDNSSPDISSQHVHPTANGHKALGRDKSFDINTIDPPPRNPRARRESTDLSIAFEIENDEDFKVWEIPKGVSKFDIFWYFFTWPIRFLLHYTIPNPIRHRKWFVLSFIMCIIWIGAVSYMVFWMAVIVGDVFNIPDAVMALTFLGFGGCMPEAITSSIVARQGSGQMGVSNSLGANSLAILFSLGIPWFIRTMATGITDWSMNDAYIQIFSHGIEFTIMSLLAAIAILYITVAVAGYKLRKKVGGVLGVGYLIIVAFAILVELDILLPAEDRC